MSAKNQILENIRSRGIGATIVEDPITDVNGNPVLNKDGTPSIKRSIVITHIPAAEKKVNEFFIKSAPCPYPGCEHLRREYFAEVAAMEATGKGCTGCQKGAIMRKYDARVRAAIKAAENNEQPINTHTGVEQIPGSGEASPARATTRRSLLRRASAGFKAFYEAVKRA